MGRCLQRMELMKQLKCEGAENLFFAALFFYISQTIHKSFANIQALQYGRQVSSHRKIMEVYF